MKKHDFWVSESMHFLKYCFFLLSISTTTLLLIFVPLLDSIWAPLGSLFGVNFPSPKKVTRFFSKCSWVGGICDTSEIRGELEASQRHLEPSGCIWEASGGHMGRRLGRIWRHLEASGSIWEASGRHLGGIWAPKVFPGWSEGSEAQKSVTPLGPNAIFFKKQTYFWSRPFRIIVKSCFWKIGLSDLM